MLNYALIVSGFDNGHLLFSALSDDHSDADATGDLSSSPCESAHWLICSSKSSLLLVLFQTINSNSPLLDC